MDSLAKFISNLPLDDISDALSKLTIWWSSLVADIDPEKLPLYAYVGFCVVVLILWLLVARVIPKPFGSISWIALFALLLTPNLAINDPIMMSGNIAPASTAAVYGLLTEDTGLFLRSLVPICLVFFAGLLLGFIWQLIRNIIESNTQEIRHRVIDEEKANLRMATANYSSVVNRHTSSKGKLSKLKKK